MLRKLAEVRNAIGGLVKDKTADAGKYSYDYITLNLIIAQDPILLKHGLMFVDTIKLDGVYTRLYDTDTGGYIESVFPYDTVAHGREGMVDGLTFQDNGKTITYGKRYNRLTILGLPQDDAETEKPVERRPAKGSTTPKTTNTTW